MEQPRTPMTITAWLEPDGVTRLEVEGERPDPALIARHVCEMSGPALWNGFLEAIKDPARKAEFDRLGREVLARVERRRAHDRAAAGSGH